MASQRKHVWGGRIVACALILSACGEEQSPVVSPESAMFDAPADGDYGPGIRSVSVTSPGRLGIVGEEQIRDSGLVEPDQVSSESTDSRLYLAYRFNTSLLLPAGELAAAHAGHAEACFEAGRDVCQVISSSVESPGGRRPSAYLQLRASPAWIVEFRETIATEIEAAGGEITTDETSIEDLTAQIVDAEARLEARTTLRDRLQTLLETRDGELNELLQVERELARVQEQLDAQASVLAVLRQRVNTSTLSLSYHARREVVERQQFNPIWRAITDVGGIVSDSLADVIRFLAAFLPWLIVIIPAGWLLRRFVGGWLKRRREAKATKSG